MPIRHLVLPGLLLCASCTSHPTGVPLPDDHTQDWSFGSEVQGYPAGIVLAGHARRALSEHDELTFRVGYNITDRQDFGEQDDERGDGPGGGIGYRRTLQPHGEDGWLWGARVDLWDLEIDWKDDPSTAFPAGRKGTTDVLVLQPTAEVGYGWWLEVVRLELVLALGAEINVDTDGRDVGEGAILLLGVTALF